jgi:hypothetical protein
MLWCTYMLVSAPPQMPQVHVSSSSSDIHVSSSSHTSSCRDPPNAPRACILLLIFIYTYMHTYMFVPQVHDVNAPEFARARERFYALWERVWSLRKAAGDEFVTATMEYGPPEWSDDGQYLGLFLFPFFCVERFHAFTGALSLSFVLSFSRFSFPPPPARVLSPTHTHPPPSPPPSPLNPPFSLSRCARMRGLDPKLYTLNPTPYRHELLDICHCILRMYIRIHIHSYIHYICICIFICVCVCMCVCVCVCVCVCMCCVCVCVCVCVCRISTAAYCARTRAPRARSQRHEFSKVGPIVALFSQYASVLTFENFLMKRHLHRF